MTTRAEVSLAVRLRPKSLDEVIGHDNIKPGIRKRIDHECRCWLFYGDTGTGKTSLAHIVAREIQGPDFPAHKQPDIIDFDCTDQTGSREIRELLDVSDRCYPMAGKYRVVILDEAQQLSKAAKTLLLKPLERDGEVTTVWIICTTEVKSLPQALCDRCTGQFHLRAMNSRDRQMLVLRAAEHLHYEKDTTRFLREIEQQGIGSARKILDSFERFADGVSIDDAIGVAVGG